MHGILARWESWLLRLLLLGTFIFQLAHGNGGGAQVAGEGAVVSLLPLLVARLSKTPVPRALDFVFTLGMTLQYFSESTKLFELFYYWDKVVHPTLVALTALVAGWLILGYREAYRKRIPIHLAAVFAWLTGACVGAFWEFVELTGDWFGNTDLQKSNGDTMTDMLANDIGAFVATLVGFWIFVHRMTPEDRQNMGRVARWLASGPSRLLDRHGRMVGAAVAVVVVGLLAASQWVDRNTPALAANLSPGTSQQWTFSQGSLPPDAQVLLGDWLPDPSAGVCRENLDHPRPGSEKMGLLELAAGSSYGQDGQPFSMAVDYYEQRPPALDGTEMDAGIAFGIRDAKNFYLLEQSALHDILRLDRYVNGKRRDLRETVYRTHGNEWHALQVNVQGGQVTATVDGSPAFSVQNLPATDGGIGLWGLTSSATCFSDAQLQVNPLQAALPFPGLPL